MITLLQSGQFIGGGNRHSFVVLALCTVDMMWLKSRLPAFNSKGLTSIAWTF